VVAGPVPLFSFWNSVTTSIIHHLTKKKLWNRSSDYKYKIALKFSKILKIKYFNPTGVFIRPNKIDIKWELLLFEASVGPQRASKSET
jgi:hypothetical protein